MDPTRAYAAALADQLSTAAQLAAAGITYGQLATAYRTTPRGAHSLAQAGALLLQRSGTTPPELRDALTALPPLDRPAPLRSRSRRRRPQLPDGPAPPVDPAALDFTPDDLDALTAAEGYTRATPQPGPP